MEVFGWIMNLLSIYNLIKMGEKVSQSFINMLILAMILTGAGNTIGILYFII